MLGLVLLASSAVLNVHLAAVTPQTQCSGTVVALPSGAGRLIQVPINLTGDTRLELPSVEKWRVSIRSENCWSAPLEIDSTSETIIRVDVWPKGWIAGTLSVPAGSSAPKQIQLEFHHRSSSAMDSAAPLLGVEVCSVSERAWRCPSPVTDLDVRFSAEGFASAYRWGLAFRDREIRLGQIRLVPGASLVGWLEDRTGSPLANAEILLTPGGVPTALPTHQPAPADRPIITRSNEHGFFQFEALEGGDFVLEATKNHMSLPRPVEIDVRGSQENVLRKPLVLDPPGSVVLSVDPSVSGDGKQWSVTLTRIHGGAEQAITTGQADETGLWKLDDVQRGFYSIIVRDHLGMTVDRIDLHADSELTRVESHVGAVPIEGHLSIGASPVAAKMRFQSATGDVKLRSARDGYFQGSLPAAGDWSVGIVPEGALQNIKTRVSVRESKDGGRVTVDLDLPGGTVEGLVNDETGKSVRSAVIVARRGTEMIGQAVSDTEGHFSVTGLANGDIALYAFVSELFSEERHVAITSGASVTETLTLRGAVELRGAVTYASGRPAIGALVRYLRGNQVVTTVTGPTGAFSADVEPGATFADVVVLTSKRQVVIDRVPVSPDRVKIVVEEPPALLRIARDESGLPQVSRTQRLLPLFMLFAPPDGFDQPPEVSDEGYQLIVSPGLYRVCYSQGTDCVVVNAKPGEVAKVAPKRVKAN